MNSKYECPYCDGRGFSRLNVDQKRKCPKCGGKGYRVRNAPVQPVPAQPITQPHTAPPAPVVAALATLSDADLKARCEAAWSHLFVYLDEIRRRAGVVINNDAIPF